MLSGVCGTVLCMSTTTNKYAGKCGCGTAVEAGAGRLGPKVAGRWTVRCIRCATPAGMTAESRRFVCECGSSRCGGCDYAFDAWKDAGKPAGGPSAMFGGGGGGRSRLDGFGNVVAGSY